MTRRTSLKRALLTTFGAVAALAALGFGWLWFAPCWMGGCAPVEELSGYQAEGSQLLDIHGEPYGTLATVNRHVIPLDSLPPFVTQAFVAVEDRRFYDHAGVDFRRVAGALVENIQEGGVAEGGSTITMQLARNLFPEWLPYTEQSLRRKLLEVRVARQIERAFAKDKILELYLNHIYLGAGAYGIEAAARAYFGKPAAELTLDEAAVLAALPKAPSELNPRENPEAARERRDLVLQEMAEAGFVSATDAQAAQEGPIQLAAPEGGEAEGLRGSYFIERVRQEMEQLVGSRFYTAGLRIHTTLDPAAQRAAEDELAQQLDAIEAGRYGTYRHPTYPEAVGGQGAQSGSPYLQGAVVVMDASTGEVRALVGGRDFEDSNFDRATQALRQPGSAFKPFVYLSALERFGTPAHMVEDAPVRLTLASGQVWAPENYSGDYQGPMTMRSALARSKNSVAVRLAQAVGMDRVIDNAHRLGVTSDIPSVPSTALGTAGVRPLELVRAYATLANMGERVEPHFIRRVVDRHGRTLWQATPRSEQVLDPALAFVLNDMLREVVDRGTGSVVRTTGFQGLAAGKTGTTNEATDVWFVGYTPELVGGVWIGLDEPQTIVRGASGGTLAAPIWGRIMRRVYEDRPTPAPWTPPAGVVRAEVERATGTVANPSCPGRGPTYTEFFVGSAPRPGGCYPESPYPRTAAGTDSSWWDEEWTGERIGDEAYDLDETGIDWPELEEQRRRAALDGDTTLRHDTILRPDTTLRPDTPNDVRPWIRATEEQTDDSLSLPRREAPPTTGVQSADTSAADTASAEASPEALPTRPDELLGDPVQRDTTTEADVGGSSGAPEPSRL